MSGDDKLNIALDGVGLAASIVGAGAIAVGAAPVAIGAAAVGATVALGSLAVSSFVGSNADKGVAASGVFAGIGPSFLPEAGSLTSAAANTFLKSAPAIGALVSGLYLFILIIKGPGNDIKKFSILR